MTTASAKAHIAAQEVDRLTALVELRKLKLKDAQRKLVLAKERAQK